MKRSFFFVLAVIGTGALFAQTEIKTVRTGEKLSDVFTAKDIFRYETFLPGKVLFKDGTTAEAPLNYNRIYEQMMFLDAKGDSLAVANPELVNVIVIGSNNFYFAAEVVLEELNDYGNVKLATHEVLREIDKKILGAYGSTTDAKSISYYKHEYTIDGKPVQPKPGEGTLFSKKADLYIGDSYNHFMPASKKAVESVYAKKAKELKAYLKDNPVKYDNVKDLQRLCEYMQAQ